MAPMTQTHTYICVYCILEVRAMRQIDHLFLVLFQIGSCIFVLSNLCQIWFVDLYLYFVSCEKWVRFLMFHILCKIGLLFCVFLVLYRVELLGLCFRFVLFVLFRINLIPFVLSVSEFFSWFHLNEVFAFIFSTKYILSSTFVQRSY